MRGVRDCSGPAWQLPTMLIILHVFIALHVITAAAATPSTAESMPGRFAIGITEKGTLHAIARAGIRRAGTFPDYRTCSGARLGTSRSA